MEMGILALTAGKVALAAFKALTEPDDLHVLAMRMDISGSEPKAIFRFDIDPRFKGRDKKPVKTWEFCAGRLGIPERIDSARGLALMPKIPDEMFEGLKSELPTAKDVPLWLSFESPAGYLGLVSWEEALQPRLDRPVLRLLDLAAPLPREVDETLDVALCVSIPKMAGPEPSPEQVAAVATAIAECKARDLVRVHLFTGAKTYAALSGRSLPGEVRLYDPEQAPREPVEQRIIPENRWFPWICSVLKNEAVDVVHFYGHGYLRCEQGLLAMTESPLESDAAVFVAPGEINKFAIQAGAWSVVLDAPPDNFSCAGLRQLANAIAGISGRSLVLHDRRMDASDVQLASTYRFLYKPGAAVAPATDAVALYCHPSLVEVQTPAGYLGRAWRRLWPSAYGFEPSDALQSLFAPEITQPLREVLRSQGTVPPWLASMERYIEQRALDLRRQERSTLASSPELRQQIEDGKKELHAMQTAVARVAASGERK